MIGTSRIILLTCLISVASKRDSQVAFKVDESAQGREATKRMTASCSAYGDYKEGEKVDEKEFPIRIGKDEHGLPESLQGVFWLTTVSSDSALVSFAPSKDGNDLSKFRMTDDKKNGTTKIRVAGDRIWSFHKGPWIKTGKYTGHKYEVPSLFSAIETADLVYDFKFDFSEPSTWVDIFPIGNPFGNFLGMGISPPESLLDFNAFLLHNPAPASQPNCYSEQGGEQYRDASDFDYCSVHMEQTYNQSYVWQRKSNMLGYNVGGTGREGTDYKWVQIVKGDGTKLPAFASWVNFCNKEKEGKLYYHEKGTGDYWTKTKGAAAWKGNVN